MRKWLLPVLLAISAITVGAQQVELGLTPTNNAVKVRLDWQALPGQTYSVGTTTNLVSTNWMETIVAASNVLGAFEVESTNHAQFFRLVKQDTDCPSVTSLSPQDRAVAVVSNTAVNISLADETGIDTNSILFDIGPWTGLTLTSPQVTWSSNTITFTPPDILGQAGGIVTNGLTVSDSLGYTLSNYTWTFQLTRPTVATNSFLPLTAPANGIQMMSDGSTQLRKIPGIRPLDGTDAYHIVSVTSNTVVFSYAGSLPAVSNGTILVSFDAAYPFYRSIASNTLDETQHQITAWTFDIPLTELVSEGSFSSIHFTPAQQAGSQQLLWGGNLNSLHAEFGDDLSGQVLYESDGLKLWLPSASWSLDGNVDVAFDMKWAKLLSLDATASARLTVNVTPEAIFSQAISGSGERPLCTPVTRLFGGMAGPIPVWVQVTAELNAGYEYTADASASVRTTVHAQKDLTFRVSLRDDQWTSGYANPPIVLTSDPIIWQLEGAASAKVYIQPKLTVLVYSLAGLWADMDPYARIAGEYQVNPLEYGLGLSFGLSSTLGIESQIWYPTWGDKPEWPLFDLNWLLWSTNYPGAPVFDTPLKNQSVEKRVTVTLMAYASGTPTPTYQWYYGDQRIVGAQSPIYTFGPVPITASGKYSIIALNSNGAATNSCVVTVGNDVYVSAMGNDLTGSGMKNSPWRTISNAVLRSPGSSTQPINIHVSAGTYQENLFLSGYQSLLGGYSADFSDRHVEDRENPTYRTVIDGANKDQVIELDGKETQEREISGFVIRNGSTGGSGGGISGRNSAATVRYNTISGNTADDKGGGIAYCAGVISQSTISGNTAGDKGGGVFMNDAGTLDACSIHNNCSEQGAGVWFQHGGVAQDCTISNNIATVVIYGGGGGIYCLDGGILSNCDITANSAPNGVGGGVNFNSGGTVQGGRLTHNVAVSGGGALIKQGVMITNCTIRGNEATTGEGGGVNCAGGGTVQECHLAFNSAEKSRGGAIFMNGGGTVTACQIDNNHSEQGGGIGCSSGALVSGCDILSNTTENGGGGIKFDAGGVVSNCLISGNSTTFLGGGVLSYQGGSLLDCVVTGNTATEGGGGALLDGGSIANCTISGNNTANGQGGGVAVHGGIVTNCTIEANQAHLGGGGVECSSDALVTLCTILSNTSMYGGGIKFNAGGIVTDCLVQGNSAVSLGGGVATWQTGSTLTRCTVTANSAPAGGGLFFQGGCVTDCIITGNTQDNRLDDSRYPESCP